MILIADGGSTKCDWALVDENTELYIKTDGMNPYFASPEQIEHTIKKQLLRKLPKDSITQIDRVCFFGAGCREDKYDYLKDNLQKWLPKAEISVEGDMKGAALALLGRERGIACILGTGSASCLYDGIQIVEFAQSLGYILGDEGSGATMGKTLVADYFKYQMPEPIRGKFFKKYKLTPQALNEAVYRGATPNRFLASFAPFLSKNIAEPYIYNLVFDSFMDFMGRNITQYTDFQQEKISFCGSIAYYFSDVLEVVVGEFGMEIGKIIKSPIAGMVEFFRTNKL